ncbi:hypothetical protein Tco_0038653 [Tanacetum coccineum]
MKGKGLPSFQSGFGKGQVVLDFENSAVRILSAERDIRKPAVFNDGSWLGLNAVTGSYRDDFYNNFFRQTGSVETQDSKLVVTDVSFSSSTNVITLESRRVSTFIFYPVPNGVKNNTLDEAEKRMTQRMSNGFDALLKLPF